ncbi:MAG: response regulator [Clostridiales bacterium]|nr:response regulator [Clostridiales bacterium]
MSLYRLFLVDDEEEIREGIIRKISWEKLGFVIVGDAANGRDALETIEQLEPDVLMTDIRMPYMDGLELTRCIHQKYPSMKVLIFSGYDDFEYAKQAIKLGVTEYILKPVNVEELSQILTKVRENLDEEIRQRRDLDRLRKSYRESLPILRELFLNELVSGKVRASQIPEKLTEYGIDLAAARKWIAAVISVEANDAAGFTDFHQKELAMISVSALIEDNLKNWFRFALFRSTEGLALLITIDGENTQTGLIDQLGDICKECRKILEITVTIGIGHSCQSLDEALTSYRSALDALGYKAIVGTGETIYINDVEPVSRGNLQFDRKDEDDLIAAVKFGSRREIEGVIHRLIARMDDAKVHIRQHQLYMLSILNILMQMVQQYGLEESEIFAAGLQYMDVQQLIRRGEEYEKWTVEIAFRISERLNRERDNTSKRAILDARKYIQENYQNPDLSVEMICRELHMSQAYFSTLFRKETGQTYIAYLTELRLDRAVELLNTTDDKTYVIAQKVGYQEQNYFSYVFKKRYGMSPTKYRGMQKRE